MWLQTKTGKQFHLDRPFWPSQVMLEDIAHAEAMTARFGGHCSFFYSVGEHSLNVRWRVRELAAAAGYTRHALRRLELGGLMHDAGEAYIGDIPTPLKRWLGDPIADLERRTMKSISIRFGGFDYEHPLIKQADRECLAAEALALFHDPPPLPEWCSNFETPWEGCRVVGMSPVTAKAAFISAANSLGAY
jgi:hypothetical protein